MSLETEAETICRVTLVGPVNPPKGEQPPAAKLWSGSPWRRLIVELEVGGPSCPNWDHANVCLTAIQDLIKMNDGFMSDELIEAISTHMKVVAQENFRGPFVPA
jgi:hypothetical protein